MSNKLRKINKEGKESQEGVENNVSITYVNIYILTIMPFGICFL